MSRTTADPAEIGPDEIPALWERIERALSALDPQLTRALNPPASDESIVSLEEAPGQRLPATFVASLKVHGGETEDAWTGGFYPSMGFLPARRIAEFHQMEAEIRQRDPSLAADSLREDPDEWRRIVLGGIGTIRGNVKAKLFNPAWIPIADTNGDIHAYLDFDPPRGGSVGQVIEVYPEAVHWEVLADSFGSFLQPYALDLEAGRYHVDDELGLERVDEPEPNPKELPPYLR